MAYIVDGLEGAIARIILPKSPSGNEFDCFTHVFPASVLLNNPLPLPPELKFHAFLLNSHIEA